MSRKRSAASASGHVRERAAIVAEAPAEEVPVVEPVEEQPKGRQADFLWGGRPVYRCRVCPYERVEGLAAVVDHETVIHGLARLVEADVAPVLVEG